MKSLRDIKLEAWHHEMVNGFPEVYVMAKPMTGPVAVPMYLSDELVAGMPGQPICRTSDGHLFDYDVLVEAWRYHDISAHYSGYGLAQRYHDISAYYSRYGLAQRNEKLVESKVKGGQ